MREVGQIQEVVHHYLTDEVVAREAVEVVHAEVQLAHGQLGVGHGEEEDLVKHRVQSLAVHLGLVLGLPLGQQVDLDIGVGRAREVLGGQVLGPVDLNDELLQVAVILEDKEQAAAAIGLSLVFGINGALLVQLGLDAAQRRYRLLSLELGHIEVRVGQVHLPAD